MKIGIVVAEYNYEINMMMLDLAKEHATFLEADVSNVMKVPGIFEIPLAVKTLLSKGEIDGAVAPPWRKAMYKHYRAKA